ncbi:MAG: hypothetical protein Q4C70_12300, partial [Planctomycetia bacterium]|nr:hypothetical protein [Planctomycetia bacterium]
MKSSFICLSSLGLAVLCVVLSSGCAQNQQAIARLEQENAQQRERIWRSNRKMEDFRRENEALRQQIASLQGKNNAASRNSAYSPTGNVGVNSSAYNMSTNSIVQPIPGNSGNVGNGGNTRNNGNGIGIGTSTAPVTQQPPASTLGNPSAPQSLPPNPATGTQVVLGNGTGNGVGTGVAPRQVRVRKTDSANVHSVILQTAKVRAIGTEGIHAEFQLRDASGDILLAPAPLEVSVLTPSGKTSDKPMCVSEWKYTAEDVANIINNGQAGLTIPLDMAWARSCPQNQALELQILYYTSDKRILIHRVPINLTGGSSTQTAGNVQ